MIGAFDRFLNDDKYSDSGCTALTAIANALYELGEATGEAVFLAGVKHVQMEGSFGPPVDVATELRGICGLGLVRVGYRDVMTHLVDLLADPEPQVRSVAARALAYSERPEAGPLVRFKLLTGDKEIDVVTECMNALVRLEPRRAVSLLGEFLEDSEPDIRMSAALALGETRQPEALELLRGRVPFERDDDARRNLLVAVSLLRLPAAIDWLVSRVSEASIQDAAWAIEALAMYRRDAAVADRVKAAAGERKDPQLERAIKTYFADG
jgi:HEAT repeat protein